MKTEPGHCYLANFIGVEHQVLHTTSAGAEAGRGYTKSGALGDVEVVYLARSAFSWFPSAPTSVGFWSGLEARLCDCTCAAFAKWAATAKIEVPSLADLKKRRGFRATRVSETKKRRRTNPEANVE